jgi:HAD superfamily hydrolase (TIGR01549 family)
MRIQAIFLDLDGTLFDFDDAAWADTVADVCKAIGQDRPDLDTGALTVAYTGLCREFFEAVESSAGEVPVRQADGFGIWRELWRQALADCGQSGTAVADEAVRHYVDGRAARYQLFADALPAITHLRERVGRLALITNGPADTQQHKIDVVGLAPHFDAIVISGAAGVAKPDPAIFELAAAQLDLAPSAIWHVGDSLQTDVAGALNAHLGGAVWLNRSGVRTTATQSHAQPHFEVVSLAELAALLA